MKKLLAFFLVVLSTIAFNRCNPYDTVPSAPLTTLTFTVGEEENAVMFNMVLVKAGSFQMGDPGSTHEVTLTQDYWMGKYEVTQGLWEAVMGTDIQYQREIAEGPRLYGEGNSYPMYYVSWDDICGTEGFLKKLNMKLATELGGKHFALPTEAQWEFAAAGGKAGYNADGTRKHTYSGGNTVDDVAWYKINSGSKTHEVGNKTANELGIYDMSGNVWEWCADWYGAYGAGSVTDPAGPVTGSNRVLRGGSWYDIADRCTVSIRDCGNPVYRYDVSGFRLALLP